MVSLIVDKDIVLRTYKEEDAAVLFALVNKWRTHLQPWLSWIHETTKEEHSLQFIQHALFKLEMQEELALGIWYRDTFIGGIGMHGWDHDTRLAQLGYWLASDFEGQGVIHKCMIKFIDFLFDNSGMNKLEIRFVISNIRSARVAERLGFRVEGIIRQSHCRNGLIEDLVVTGLLKDEWNSFR